MKIVIIGASGIIGRELVHHFQRLGHHLLLVGRNSTTLSETFPEHQVCDYTDLASASSGYDVCVHLAVMNNTATGNIEDFRSANVQSLQKVYNDMKKASVKHFINLTSFHASNPKKTDSYAVSKREADTWLAQQRGIRTTVIRLPAVYGKRTVGNLSKIKSLPKFLRKPLFVTLSAFKPVASMDRVVLAIANIVENAPVDDEIAIADPATRNPVFAIFKTLIDWGFALSVILFFWWVLLATFCAVKFTSKGPPIFSQERIGYRGKRFTCYKFRTMRTDTKVAATHNIQANAITGIGAFLRKTKIDELPQVVNIFRGELSLVGPRPCLPIQADLISERQKRDIFSVLPGITGWAQINDIDMSDPKRLAIADQHYIARTSIAFELLIILKTFVGSGQGDRTANYTFSDKR